MRSRWRSTSTPERLGVERLEDRVVLSASAADAGPPVWAGTEVLGPDRNGVEYHPTPDAPSGFALWTPTARLVAPSQRLFFGDLTVGDLQARATDPAYAEVWSGLRAWSTAWPNQAPYTTTVPWDLDAEDPWRNFATNLQDTLVTYLADPSLANRTADLGTLTYYFDLVGDWFDADNVAAPGTRSAATPTADLVLSQLISTYAVAYDWLKHDPNFTPAQIDTIRDTLIQLTRSLEYDQQFGGPAAQWVVGYQHNHNWWNYWAFAQAGVALYGESASPLQPDDAHRWLDAAVNNYWYVFAEVPSGGAPAEGYLYQAYGDDPLVGMAVLVDQLLNVPDGYRNEAALNAQSDGLFHALLPNGYGRTSFAHDNTFRTHRGSWSQHYFASEFGNTVAQFNAGYLTENATDEHLDWQSMFFFEPSVAEFDRASATRWFDDDDMGVYYARSSWDDVTDPTVLQFRAGPGSGQTSANEAPPWGRLGGHVTPEQGHVILYSGDNPVLPTGGYTSLNSTLEYNAIVFGGRDGDGGLVGFDGTILGAATGPVGQQGGDSPFLGGDYDDALDHARVIRTTHDESGGVHSYLADLGGRYRLSDLRSQTGYLDPSYQRYVFYLETGAVAIVDRVKVDEPRDIYHRVPLYDSTVVPVGSTFFYNTIDGVDGSVRTGGSSSDGTLTTYVEEYVSNSYASGESLVRDVITQKATDATEAVFVTVVGIDNAAGGVSISADGSAVTLNGTTYEWAELARGDTSAQAFDGIGFNVGEEPDGAPFVLGRGSWSSASTSGSTEPLATVEVEPDGNAYLAGATDAQGVATNDYLRFTPLPQDLGISSWDDLETVELTFDLKLFDANQPGNTSVAWELEVARDNRGLNQGRGAWIRVLSDGSLQVETRDGLTTSTPLAVDQWTPVVATLDYATKSIGVTVDGIPVVSGETFDLFRSDDFGRFGIELGGAGAGGHRQIGLDNLRIANVAAPAASSSSFFVSAGIDAAAAAPLDGAPTVSQRVFATGATGEVVDRSELLLLTANKDTRNDGSEEPSVADTDSEAAREDAVASLTDTDLTAARWLKL